MPTKRIILREHIRGSKIGPLTDLDLSLGDEDLSYDMILNPTSGQLEILYQDNDKSLACITIHTQRGFICIEALKPIIKVQSSPPGFDGTLSNGIMPLRVSSNDQQILYQIQPGESIFIDSHTISIVPEKYQEFSISSSDPENFREHASQDTSQLLPSRRFETPRHDRIRSMLSSPAKSSGLVKQMATAVMDNSDDNREAHRGPAKHSFLDVIRDMSTKREMTDAVRDVALIERPKKDHVMHGPVNEMDADDDNANPSNNSPSSATRRSMPYTVENQARDDLDFEVHEGTIAMTERGSTQSDQYHSDVPEPSKRRKLIERPSSTPLEETQDSLRTNILVQVPTRLRLNVVQEATGTNVLLSPQRALSAYTDAEKSQNIHLGSPSDASGFDSPMTSSRVISKELLGPTQLQPSAINILFASSTCVDDSKPLMRWLKMRGVKRVSNVTECTALCVSGSAALKKSSKLILAVLHGKRIITEDWITQSASAGKLLDFQDFKASDPQREAEWGVDLDEAIERGIHLSPKPFYGWTIAFTLAARNDAGVNGFRDLKEIALCAGAKSCSMSLPKKIPERHPLTLVIACPSDPASEILKGTWRLFSRDIIGLSSLRGQLNIESDEFLVSGEAGVALGKGNVKRN